ncbi:leucyl-tRNA synthetase [Candidatus Acidianus copahuensis]|uniref:Leucine--tRNA ligase n=1 Tax=Candidatus Acidianus copahuensis TaxID=1160895 RepID=A0A031LKH0_9CREN|nr:leucine--tRNA ligase [Candidatus Acidianus copahuensis]EZQ02051.1 leucyl-tRNA synthetase [Candidatus Acidianus copahuensis]
MSAFFNSIAEKWQRTWEEQKIFEANPDKRKDKFFITVPFPYTNSPMHIGHGRTYVTADIYARYMRMKGKNVLFPFAFQFTGTPILAVADGIRRGDKELIDSFVKIYNIPEEKLKELADPYKLAEYFKDDMEKSAKSLGLSVDWRRSFTTTDKRFSSLIQWQFKKLKEAGKLVIESDAVSYCPRDQFPVGMHDTKGDIEPEIDRLDVILFEGEYLFPVSTSRPETVFGGNGLAVNPEAEYVVAETNGKKYILSSDSFFKLSFQRDLKETDRMLGSELVGRKAINPVTLKEVEVIGSGLVNSNFGTGIVMLVPAHDPIHKAMIEQAGEEVDITPVIRSPDLPEVPTEDIEIANMAELKDYAETIYRTEFYKGVMREDIVDLVPDYMRQYVKERIAGRSVKEGRMAVVDLLKNLGRYDSIYEITNGPVFCRCGAQVVVKTLEKQWFIAYDDPEWKRSVLKSLDKVDIVPPEAKKEFEKVIFDLRKRVVGRSRGLGVKLPWDESQIIDSLSDSTLYTVFYTVSHLLKEANDKELDYIFLGLPAEVNDDIKKLREEFQYWYPIDVRSSGRDLVQNHLPYFIYNHLVIFGESGLPKEIVLNGFVRVGGKKMSKSFRNIYPLKKAIEEYGVDPVRVALTSTAEIYQDIEFNERLVTAIAEQLRRLFNTINYIIEIKREKKYDIYDKWLSSIIAKKVGEIDQAYKTFEFKKAMDEAIYSIYDAILDYLDMTESPSSDILKRVASAWIRMISPLVPHLAEELWSKSFTGLVVNQDFPKPEEFQVYPEAVLQVEYLKEVVNRIRELVNVVGKEPSKVVLYVSTDKQKMKIAIDACKAIQEGKSAKDFLSTYGGDVSAERIYNVVKSYEDDFRKYMVEVSDIDEVRILAENARYITSKLGIPQLAIYDAGDPTIPDMKERKGQALPLYPSILIL